MHSNGRDGTDLFARRSARELAVVYRHSVSIVIISSRGPPWTGLILPSPIYSLQPSVGTTSDTGLCPFLRFGGTAAKSWLRLALISNDVLDPYTLVDEFRQPLEQRASLALPTLYGMCLA